MYKKSKQLHRVGLYWELLRKMNNYNNEKEYAKSIRKEHYV